MIALLAGTVIALLAVAFVLVPLFRDDAVAGSTASPSDVPRDPPEDAIGALREIEFDRQTGKLSDADYDALKARYTADALESMRAAEHTTAAEAADAPATDLAEEAILRYRRRVTACSVCGPRPEPDAAFCSTCGRYLRGACSGCGAPVTEPGARFCTTCGKTLAA